jgi:radical SAM protein with 4Fe4S-binding SPASM domain
MKVKSPQAANRVCVQYCSFYKPDSKEALACQGLVIIERLFDDHPDFTDDLASQKDTPSQDAYPHLLRQGLCQHCAFVVDGCDFAATGSSETSSPCGGYIAITHLLRESPGAAGRLLERLIPPGKQMALNAHCTLKHLEKPCLYDIKTDELYELDENAFDFLKHCDGTQDVHFTMPDAGFVEFCLQEQLLVFSSGTIRPRLVLRRSPIPSLRYLELQLTTRCNLRCKHCYLDGPSTTDMPLPQVLSVLAQFEKMQGLRILFSGGEPLLYPELQALTEALPSFAFRKVLLTNGTLLTEENHDLWRHFDEIQVSVDGLKQGHEILRGPNTYGPAIRGMDVAHQQGKDVSIATMVHQHNLKAFSELALWIEGRQVVEWNIDVPCKAGRLSDNPELAITPEQGAPFLRYATGGSYHGAEEPFACGYHLCTVTASGDVLKCSFFPESPLGSVDDGLERAWKKSRPIPLSDLKCAPCPHLLECKGGCRFRAASLLDKDPVMCALFNEGPLP